MRKKSLSFAGLPTIQGGSADEMVSTVVGNTVLLPCALTGNPEPSVAWTRDSGILPVNRTVNTPIGIAIDEVQVEDTGRYTCTATNIFGSTTKTFNLVVQSMHLISLFNLN